MRKNTRSDDYERRKQDRLHRLGTDLPRCAICGNADWRVIEEHHPAGRKQHKLKIHVCANCHKILSDNQKDHPNTERAADDVLARIGNFLLGFADMLAVILEHLYEFGETVIARANAANAERAK